jgi:hypothetical protein
MSSPRSREQRGSSPREHSFSSPPKPLTYGRDGRKERRNPSVTPRKFSRFFTPRSHSSIHLTSARQALNDITACNNRNGTQSSPLGPFKSITAQEDSPTSFSRDLKRRKLFHTLQSSPDHKYSKESDGGDFSAIQGRNVELTQEMDDSKGIPSSPCDRPAQVEQRIMERENQEPTKRITPVNCRGLGGRLLQSSYGVLARPRRQHIAYPAYGIVLIYEDYSHKLTGY